MNVLLLEDNDSLAAQIASAIGNSLADSRLYHCTDLPEALAVARDMPMDLFIVDMDTECGYEYADWLRSDERYAMAWLVILASDGCLLAESLQRFHCYSYIVKPVDEAQLAGIVLHLSRYSVTNTSGEYITFTSKRTNHRIAIDSIKYIEVNLKQLRITTDRNRYELGRYPLARVKSQLPESGFVQCHRSYIVNRACVNSVRYTSNDPCLMVGEDRIPIGNTYVSMIKDIFSTPRG